MSRTPKTKSSVSNGIEEADTPQEYAYFQAQRYGVELMACVFLLKEKLLHLPESPLLSVRDVRLLIVARLFGTKDDGEQQIHQMECRHQKRQKDIERYYRE